GNSFCRLRSRENGRVSFQAGWSCVVLGDDTERTLTCGFQCPGNRSPTSAHPSLYHVIASCGNRKPTSTVRKPDFESRSARVPRTAVPKGRLYHWLTRFGSLNRNGIQAEAFDSGSASPTLGTTYVSEQIGC